MSGLRASAALACPRVWLLWALCSLLLAACAQVPRPPAIAAAPAGAAVYVVRRGWHIDIGFAAADLRGPLAAVAAQMRGTRYVFFGFGDRRYVLAKDRNAPVLLSALWPGAGMILVTALRGSPAQAFGADHAIALRVTDAELAAAQSFIWNSLQNEQPYGPGPYVDSLYYSAVPRYSALHTCNTWAAEALKAAHLPIRSAGVSFAGQLWRQVRRLERSQTGASAAADLLR